MTIRVGLFGAAWGAFAHLPAWRAIPGVEVVAVCTSRRETAEAAAARFGIARPFWDGQAFAADPDIDLIDFGTRPSVRLPHILTALAAGKHIYNACPHAPHWDGAKALDTAWRSGGGMGVVDAFSAWLPAHRQMRRMLNADYLGPVLGGTARFNLSLFNRPSKHFPYNWFADADAGVSAMRNNGSHLLYVLLDLLGPVRAVMADEAMILPEWRFDDGDTVRPANPDLTNAILQFESGARIALQASWAMPVQAGWSVDLFGADGRLLAESPTFPTAKDCTLEAAKMGEALNIVPPSPEDLAAPRLSIDASAQPAPAFPMALSMAAMVAHIRGEAAAPTPDFALALEVERTLEAIRRASAERREVAIQSVQ